MRSSAHISVNNDEASSEDSGEEAPAELTQSESDDDVDDELDDIGLVAADPITTERDYPFPIVAKEAVTLQINDKVVVYYVGTRAGWYEGTIEAIDTTFHFPKYSVLYKDGLADESLQQRGYGSSKKWVKPVSANSS
jgi:hypothetical protein